MKTSYHREDFENQNEVRWCPGCGDYAILKALQCLLPELGAAPHEHVFVSGIGCAGRLPYYMNTYGFHTIHGRAPAVATGLALMRPDLHVWVITGDGDALSIGTNHLIHCLRRNIKITILLFNNEVYGLTKGQFSPTSRIGQVTRTSPSGTQQRPLNPLLLALASGATFVARAIDKDPQALAAVLKAAWEHDGCAFIEIYQDCHIFNAGAFDAFSLKNNRAQHTLRLVTGEPLYFGEGQQLTLSSTGTPLIMDKNDSGICTRHDPTHFIQAMQLAQLGFPEFPVPLGIYYQQTAPSMRLQENLRINDTASLSALYRAKGSWTVT